MQSDDDSQSYLRKWEVEVKILMALTELEAALDQANIMAQIVKNDEVKKTSSRKSWSKENFPWFEVEARRTFNHFMITITTIGN